MAIRRKLPGTIVSRQKALNQAKDKDSLVPLTDKALTPTTIARLAVFAPQYNTGIDETAIAKANLNLHTPLKDAGVEGCRTYTSHFIQVFNLGVARGKYPAGARAFYNLDTTSAAVPNLDAQSDVELWAHYLVTGDPNRIAAGGAAMANPDITEVQTQLTATETLLGEQTTLEDALNTKQNAVEALNPQADSLIKHIWDEVETHFDEAPAADKRNFARQYGVVYVTEGPPAVLSGLVKDAAGAPAAGAVVTINETGATATTNAEGRYTINTTILGDVTISAALGLLNGSQTVNIPDHTDGINVNVADIVLA